jgi:hypothetical protein
MEVEITALFGGEKLAVEVKEHHSHQLLVHPAPSFCQTVSLDTSGIIHIRSLSVKSFSLTASAYFFRPWAKITGLHFGRKPMHSEMIPLEKLEAYGESTARSLHLGGNVSPRESSGRILRAAHALQWLRHRAQREVWEDGAARWLLDNWYLVEREAQSAAAAFRAAGRIRRSGDTPLVFSAAKALLSASRGSVDAERCAAFLRGFERKTVLTRRELSLFPAALRWAAAEELFSLYRRSHRDEDSAAALFSSLITIPLAA